MRQPPEQFYHIYDQENVRNSVIRIDILTFLQANPHTIDTAAGLARRLHRPLQEVVAAADTLAELGVLIKMVSGTHTIYRLRGIYREAGGGTASGPRENIG